LSDYVKGSNEESQSCYAVGYLGIDGSYSSIISKEIFSEDELFKPYSNFEQIIDAVENNDLDFGVIPIENSSTGSILEVFDLIKSSDLKIVGERCLTIQHNLITKEEIALEKIEKVYSHPQALQQCKKIIQKYQWEAINVNSTAQAVQQLQAINDPHVAAIGSKRAAEIYGLTLLAQHINYNTKNITRFIILSRHYAFDEPNDKITIGFSVKHKAGSLFEALKHFRDLKINLYKIESRPIIEKPFEYYFYLDFEGNLESEKIKSLLNLMENDTTSIKIFGNYKNHSWSES
jgi:chorismate mutase/prephenate dehydratase